VPRAALSVCERCRDQDGGDDAGPRPGARLADAIEARLARGRWSGGSVELRRICCMSQCRRPCVVAFTHPRRFTYLFGDLTPASDAAAVVETFALWLGKPDGYLTRDERAPALRAGILARIPPLGRTHELVTAVRRLPDRSCRATKENQG
jgi:predicted metal-binding protein